MILNQPTLKCLRISDSLIVIFEIKSLETCLPFIGSIEAVKNHVDLIILIILFIDWSIDVLRINELIFLCNDQYSTGADKCSNSY